MKNYKISQVDILDDGKRLFKLKYEGENFEGVEGIKLNKSLCLKHCDSCDYGWCQEHVIATFDCKVRQKKLLNFYYNVNLFVVAIIAFYVFKTSQFNFWGKLGALVLILVPFEVLCSFIENIVPKFYEKYIYQKLKKNKQKREKAEKQKQQEIEAKRIEQIVNSPNGQEIIKAETVVKRLKSLSEQYDFGPNEKKINKCVKKSEDVLAKIQKAPENYARVAYLFDAYLPEFCNTLTFYGKFIEAKAVTEEHQKTLTDCVNAMLKFLDDQKVQAVFDKETIESQFDSSAKTLKYMIEKEIKQ